MIRTQIYLPKDLTQEIELVAKRENKSKAQVIREAVVEGLGKQKPQQTLGQALLGLTELGEKLDMKAEPDLSSRIDDYLYGDK